MRRVISVFLRLWPIDLRLRRLARSNAASPDKPLVVVDVGSTTQTLVAVCERASLAGLAPGMTLAQARAIEPMLVVGRADPAGDAQALHRLAVWFLRFSPLVAPDPKQGLWLDATGVAHLFGGEEAMLAKITARLRRNHITAHVAMADTPGAAWACSRYGLEGVIAPGGIINAVTPLPLGALRISRTAVGGLHRVGVRTVGELMRLPRSTIPKRFGQDVLRRLDQLLGRASEPISPVLPPEAKRRRLNFAEPISTREGLEQATWVLCEQLCADLEKIQEGARKLDLLFTRTDGHAQAVRIGTARATRDAKHIAKMLTEQLGTVDPGFGIETATLVAWVTELLVPHQVNVLADVDVDHRELASLTDRLSNRYGEGSLYRFTPMESDIPERAVKRVGPNAEVIDGWARGTSRPICLLAHPELVEVTAMLPDHPPVMFRWRKQLHRIKRADGPERIRGEWWRDPSEIAEVRDYYKVENERGERYWLYRDQRMTSYGTFRWYLHGIFP